MSQSRIEELLDKLKTARMDAEESKTYMDDRLAEFMRTDDIYTVQAKKHATASTLKAEIEKEIKNLGLTLYEESVKSGNPDKKIADGAEIKIFKKLVIKTPSAAFGWAKKNYPAALKFADEKISDIRALVLRSMPSALVLDENAILEYAKKFGAVDGVEILDDPRVQISGKL